MKTLILVRHAKSDWPENTDDFDRPLAERGLEDAVKMSKFLKDNNIEIQKFVSTKLMILRLIPIRNCIILPKEILNR